MPNRFTGDVPMSEVHAFLKELSKHGGKRQGAGRPPAKTAKKAVTIKMKPDHVDKFNRICKSNGKSQAGQLVEWIDSSERGDELDNG